MAIDQVVAKAIVEFKGDISDLKEKMRELQGEEKKLAGEQLKRVEASNKGIDSQIAMLGRLGVIAGTVTAAVVGGMAAMEKAAERQRVATQAGAVDLDKLSAAAGGTKKSLDLLSETAKIQTGAYKLNQQQLEMVQQAMRQLTREHGNAEEVTKRVTDAIVKLEGGGLKDLGVRVREASGDSEKFAAIMESLGQKSEKLKDRNATASESVARLRASFGEATDTIVEGIGRLVAAMTPMLESLATSVGLVGKLASVAGSLPNIDLPGGGTTGDIMKFLQRRMPTFGNLYKDGKYLHRNLFTDESDWIDPVQWDPSRMVNADGTQGLTIIGSSDSRAPAVAPGSESDPWAAPLNPNADKIAAQFMANALNPDFASSQESIKEAAEAQAQAFFDAADKAAEKFKQWLETPAGKRWRMMQELMKNTGGFTVANGNTAGGVGNTGYEDIFGNRQTAAGFSLGSEFVLRDEYDRPIDEDTRLRKILGDAKKAEFGQYAMGKLREQFAEGQKASAQKNALEKVFGPVEQFDAYAKGFQMLTGAAQSAFTAWIDGSMSAGEAIKKFFADSLKSVATDMLGRSIQHGAMALASLIPGPLFNPVTAAGHAKTAAAFAAGAVVVGGLAKALHGGTATPTGAATGTGGGVSGGGSYESQAEGRHDVYTVGRGMAPTIVVQGDPFALDSQRKRAANFNRMERYARGAYGVSTR